MSAEGARSEAIAYPSNQDLGDSLMRSVFYYAIGFSLLGIIAGGAVGELIGGKPWEIIASMIIGAGFAATFGAIVGLSAAVNDLSDEVSELRDRLDPHPHERHRPSGFGDTFLPRFEEESAASRPFQTDDQIGRPPQDAP